MRPRTFVGAMTRLRRTWRVLLGVIAREYGFRATLEQRREWIRLHRACVEDLERTRHVAVVVGDNAEALYRLNDAMLRAVRSLRPMTRLSGLRAYDTMTREFDDDRR